MLGFEAIGICMLLIVMGSCQRSALSQAYREPEQEGDAAKRVTDPADPSGARPLCWFSLANLSCGLVVVRGVVL